MRLSDGVFDRARTFDLDLAVCGYETRSRYVASVTGDASTERIAIDYRSVDSPLYVENHRWYEDHGWQLHAETSALRIIAEAAQAPVSIRVDISSMKRETMARVVELTLGLPPGSVIQYVYSPAQFESSLKAASQSLALGAGPVSGFFSGAIRTPSTQVGLVAGLGLEEHRIMGVTELLEPAHTWAFVADSDDPRFAESVQDLHRVLLSSDHTDLYHYDIHSLAEVYNSLESLCFSAGQSYRIVLAPSGPKIFALACLLVAARLSPIQPAVWRVGSLTPTSAPDALPTGDVVSADIYY